jgi:hypothetical protein
LGHELIDYITLEGLVPVVSLLLLNYLGRFYFWSLLSNCFLKSLNDLILVSKDILEGFILSFLLPKEGDELLDLLFENLDFFLELFVFSLSLGKNLLQVLDDGCLLLDFKNVDVDCVL